MKTDNSKAELNQRDNLRVELQGINQLIGCALNHPKLYTPEDIAQLSERKKTLEQLINDPSANPFYCFINL